MAGTRTMRLPTYQASLSLLMAVISIHVNDTNCLHASECLTVLRVVPYAAFTVHLFDEHVCRTCDVDYSVNAALNRLK